MISAKSNIAHTNIWWLQKEIFKSVFCTGSINILYSIPKDAKEIANMLYSTIQLYYQQYRARHYKDEMVALEHVVHVETIDTKINKEWQEKWGFWRL